MERKFLVAALLAGAVGISLPHAALAGRAHVIIDVPLAPPPPPALVMPPPMVPVPGSPVLYAPGAGVSLFLYADRYYAFHNGVWFHAPTHRGPWARLAPELVPRRVLVVPARFYEVPPASTRAVPGRVGRTAARP